MITAITAFNIMLATVTAISPLAALSLSFLLYRIFCFSCLRSASGKFLRSIGISDSSGTAGNLISSMLVLPTAYAVFSIVYSISAFSSSARSPISTSMIFSIFTYTTSLKLMKHCLYLLRCPMILWYNLPNK